MMVGMIMGTELPPPLYRAIFPRSTLDGSEMR
jgi:hypothetical protein